MIEIGTITGYSVQKNKNSADNRLMLQVQMTNASDIRTVEYVTLPGQDETPIIGDRVYVAKIGASYLIGLAINDGVEPAMDTGEKRLYSRNDSGTIQAFINLLKSGIIHVNGDNDFAVRFDALDTALQLMLTALNADIVVAGGAGTTALDISAAKVSEVKLS